MFINIRNKILSAIVTKLGTMLATALSGFVAWLIVAAIHWVQYKLASLSPMLAKVLVEQLQGIDQGKLVCELWLLFMAAMNYVTNHYLTQWVAPIQEALVKLGYDLKIDGWAGDQTVGALIKETGLPVLPAIPAIPANTENQPQRQSGQ